MSLHRELSNVRGTVLWYAKAAVDNVGNYGTSLRNVYWRTPALMPVQKHVSKKAPKKVRKPKVIQTEQDGTVLFWRAPKGKGWKNEAVQYVVYRFNNGEKVDIHTPAHIMAITRNTYYRLPARGNRDTYVVTALDRLHNESKIKKVKY
jgi:hypothetical protein